ncbi:RNA polymerase sigma factor [Paenibacillus pasadenensis]|uniref:RNA polymerase sigma factor n=1 Tax=Paenibacillus pasadenensis TaxID=217090 RepID=UPI002040BFEC|nr:RNA polymerase sigma factor [Paenibacillus pasadenensis]MCM3749578.1 RNA polymerase sigma factor [Paenibacillus pasadenensis]
MNMASKLETERSALRRYCLALTGKPWEAEDLEQSVWCRALAYPGWENHANPEALLLRIARNLWTDQQRRNALSQRLLPELMPLQPETEQQADSWELELMLHSLDRRLTPLQLAVWLLREMHGSAIAETAKRLGMTEGAVKAAMHRARRALGEVRRDLQAGGLREPADEGLLARVRMLAAALRTGDAAAIAALAEQDALEPAVAAANLAGRVQASRAVQPESGAADSPQANIGFSSTGRLAGSSSHPAVSCWMNGSFTVAA